MRHTLLSLLLLLATAATAATRGLPISPNLFGIFIEDLNYTADGGLYAELVQNRSFEYTPTDLDPHKAPLGGWNHMTAWQYDKQGNAIGLLSLESRTPIHANNPHYMVMDVKTVGHYGPGLTNTGFDGIALRGGAQYRFSVFLRMEEGRRMPVDVVLQGQKGDTLAAASLTADCAQWKKYALTLTPTASADTARLTLRFRAEGRVAIDMVSLFPADTYKGRENGLRRDIAEALEALHPAFVRFPGGCLAHGDGTANIYR